jgi:hypothetical protein
MKFSLVDNLPATRRKFEALSRRFAKNQKKAMLATVLQAETIIKQRTAQGKDVNGNPFKRYSDSYSSFRAKAGRSRTPNLMFSGRMLNSMKVKASKTTGVLFFSRAEESRKAAFNNRTRRFFDLSKKELSRLHKVYFRRLTSER